MPRPRLRNLLVLLIVAPMFSSACGDDAPPDPTTTTTTGAPSTTAVASASCGEAISEPLDSASGRHLLPDQPEPTYLTDPPTSGPHRTGDHATGVLADPIEKPEQVAMLEAGQVIIQHKDVGKVDFDRITALATAEVTVAPNPTLPAAIVATAWQVKLLCRSVDEPALRSFIATFLKPTEGH